MTMTLAETLIHACKYGHIDEVRRCLDEGANVDGKGDDWSPLMWCAYYGHVEVAKVLIDHGADVDRIFTHDGKNAEDCARENNQSKFLRYLSSLPARSKPPPELHKATMATISPEVLIQACKFGKIDDACVCLDEGIDPNGKGDDWSPLMWCAYYGHIEVAELLIQHGADIDHIFFHDGKSAMDCAQENNQMKFVAFLKKEIKSQRHVRFKSSESTLDDPNVVPKGCCCVIS
ncbi:hypothetical protein Ae201684P_021028 [Aphanomyces euteiches]|uniref:Uncharacterized protein n=1 Tax=Aphanomyces euteiches TaxID=100861 RepID=A0A6G0WWZ1_9STRA|nr:hypothetical protein Ae201684_010730 [Aphanomyces euteiches]KAH9061693.1 hypothetical protein Ae201684P_021028 [Aphanomyces euteiches]KAH9142053.1 hypothetical protein AeRB84_013850 [Aphanomyces euteiches]